MADSNATSPASAAESKQQYSKEAAKEFENKSFSQYVDPCQEAAQRSIRCMHRNSDKDLCNDYFQAYRDCKKQWMEQRRQAKKGQSWFG